MKVDIEGMDSVCLEGLLSVEEKPKYISVEASATSIKDTFTQLHLLDRLGYTRFKIVPQLNITEQRCPDPAREGIFVDHRFEGGSSGLFGEEVPGEWRPLNCVKWDLPRSCQRKIWAMPRSAPTSPRLPLATSLPFLSH
jgi:hypothetical protein